MTFFKPLLCFFVVFFIQIYPNLLHAQCFKIDSLQRQLFIINRQDTNWVKTANILAKEHLQNQQESKAYWYAQQTYQISQNLKYFDGQTESLLIQADVLFKDELKRDKEAKDLYIKALEVSKNTQNKILIAKAHKSLGDYYYRLYYQNEAYYKYTLNHYLQYAEYTKATGNKGQIAKAYYLIGTIYAHLGNETESVKYFLEAVNLRSQMDTKELDDPHLFAQAQRIYTMQMESQKRFLYAFGGGIMMLSLILLLLIINIQQRQKTAQKLKAQNDEIQEKNENIAQQNQELQVQKEEIIRQNEQLIYQTSVLEKAQKMVSQANKQLQDLNNHLEDMVMERTQEVYQMNDALLKANEELDILIYRASHDFKGPVATILGLTQVGVMLAEPQSTSLEFFQKIDYTTHKMDKMLDKLHQISYLRGKEKKSTWIDFDYVITEIKERLKEIFTETNPNFVWEIDDNTKIYTDEETMIVVLQNLIENALHFRKENTNPEILLQIQKNSQDTQDWLYMNIKDNGIGIIPEYMPKIYDMFFRGSVLSKGNGLGLYVVKDALARLDASVEVESKSDSFTSFHIKIPLQF